MLCSNISLDRTAQQRWVPFATRSGARSALPLVPKRRGVLTTEQEEKS
jgi:hypothetical protein